MDIEQPLEVGKLYRVVNAGIDNERAYGRHVMVIYCKRFSFAQHWCRVLLRDDPPIDTEATKFGYSISYLYGEKMFDFFVPEGMNLRDLFVKKEM